MEQQIPTAAASEAETLLRGFADPVDDAQARSAPP